MEKGSEQQLQRVYPQQLTKLSGQAVLAELPQRDVVLTLSAHLTRLAKLYAVPNWDDSNAALLGAWILKNYKYEQLETVTKCLENPPAIEEKIWRITPDVIQAWMASYLDKIYSQREREVHNEKHKEEPEGDPDPRLAEWLKELEAKETAVRPITEEEVKKEGREKPVKPTYIPPGKEYYVLHQMKVKYGQECTDLHTGRTKPGMPSFDEWLLLQK